ncbi:MAG: chaperone NapD [Melioribacteraceae bacterium]|nr:chaperone NapD [Melioribacteraceae bacterium]
MNISSIVVSTLPENSEVIIEHFKAGDFCEFHHYEDGKIIVTIEGNDVSEEIAKLRIIEQTPNVISALMVYSFCEDDLEAEKEKLQKFGDFPDWLNEENFDAKKIRYSGNLKNHGL